VGISQDDNDGQQGDADEGKTCKKQDGIGNPA
jgi:hypothetical protein